MKTTNLKVGSRYWQQTQRLPGPVLWFGGKSNWALPAIIRLLPITNVYAEPYGGAGSILFTKDRSPVEIYNELDWRLVNLMRTIQSSPRCEKLYMKALFTLYSRQEFVSALENMKATDDTDWDDKAYSFFVAQNQGYGGISSLPGHWGRAFTNDKGVAKKVRTFYLRVDRLPRQHERLQGVDIVQHDALDVIQEYDSKDVTLFLDPPYAPDSRVNRNVYVIEQDDDHHRKLVEICLAHTGAIVLAGYNNDIYAPLIEAGWEKIERLTAASSAARNRGMKTLGTGSLKKHVARTEVLWCNPLAVKLRPVDI